MSITVFANWRGALLGFSICSRISASARTEKHMRAGDLGEHVP
jgi:hypothetical protein